MRISYWLMPCAEDAAVLQAVIRGLADRFDAPVFVPHMTLYAGKASAEEAAEAVTSVVRTHDGLVLDAGALGYTDQIAKTLFVQFDTVPEVTALSEAIRNAASTPSEYLFAPHLSLLYKRLEDATRRELAASTRIALAQIRFNRVAAMDTTRGLDTNADIEAWQEIAASTFTGKSD